MPKIKVKFKTRDKKDCYSPIKYKTKTFYLERLPICEFHKEEKTIDTKALGLLLKELIDKNFPETYNTMLWFDFEWPWATY